MEFVLAAVEYLDCLESDSTTGFLFPSDHVYFLRCSGCFVQAENSFPVETYALMDHPVFYSCLGASSLHPNFHPMRILQVVTRK